MCLCECNVVNATLSQRYLASTFLRYHNVVITNFRSKTPIATDINVQKIKVVKMVLNSYFLENRLNHIFKDIVR